MAFPATHSHFIGSSSSSLHPSSSTTSASSDKSAARTVGELTVREVIGGWSLERWDEQGHWEPLGVYSDFSTADEIRQIASSDPDAIHNGESPDRAIPFSSLGYDDEGDLPALSDQAVMRVWR